MRSFSWRSLGATDGDGDVGGLVPTPPSDGDTSSADFGTVAKHGEEWGSSNFWLMVGVVSSAVRVGYAENAATVEIHVQRIIERRGNIVVNCHKTPPLRKSKYSDVRRIRTVMNKNDNEMR